MNLIAALTDLVVGALIMPFNIEYHYYNDHWLSSALKCRIWHFFDVTVSSASIWTLAAIALDRFMVRTPYKKLSTSIYDLVLLIVCYCLETLISRYFLSEKHEK